MICPSDFIKQSDVEIPVFPTLGLNDQPSKHENKQLFYSELHQYVMSWFLCRSTNIPNMVTDCIIMGGEEVKVVKGTMLQNRYAQSAFCMLLYS